MNRSACFLRLAFMWTQGAFSDSMHFEILLKPIAVEHVKGGDDRTQQERTSMKPDKKSVVALFTGNHR
jgi:hypothetical protein